MDLKSELKKRKWPHNPPKEFTYSGSTYVREGRVFNRPLQLEQNLSEPIPPGECAITSLVTGPHGIVVGATSGARSHLFVCFGVGGHDSVYDMGVIKGARAVRRSLVVGADGTVLGGISEAEDGKKEGGLFCVPRREHPHPHKIEYLPAPVRGERVAAMAIDRGRGVAYGLSSVTGTFFAVNVKSGKVSVKGKVQEIGNFSHVLVADLKGNVYGAAHLGRLFKYDPVLDEIRALPLSLPTVAGREFYNYLDSAALDPATGLIYGGGSADGVIFVFDPEAMTIRSLGKVTAEPRCRCITVGLDGRVYGVSGETDGMGHLFCYDPEAHELRDLGIPYATSERAWHGYEFDAACTGINGEIYLGESDRISHLFIYFPPIKPAKPCAAGAQR